MNASADTMTGLFGSRLDGTNMSAAAVAEAVGTAILVFTGTAVAVGAGLHRATAGGPYGSLAVALAFGLVLAALVASLGHVSGAHLNPAVTLSLAVTRKFPWTYVPAYMGAQFVGAVLGALATWLAYGSSGRTAAHLGATYPTAHTTDLRALVVEALITFILVLVIESVATDERVGSAAVASLGVGFALAAAVFVGGPITGGAANPFRALGPMIVSGKLTDFWVYLIGPTVGGVVAALVYDRLLARGEAPEV